MVYCIIRDPPPYSVERNGKIKFFHPQGRQQFVVEGLIVGGYDVTAAIFMILLSQWAIYLHKPYFRLPAIVLCFGGFFVMYKLMISCYMFKNRWYTGWMGF
jgi:magnesium transporter 1